MKSHEIVEWNCENLWNQKKQNARGLLPRAAFAHVAMLGLEEEKADEMCRDDPQWGNHMKSHEITWNHMKSHEITWNHMKSHEITWQDTLLKSLLNIFWTAEALLHRSSKASLVQMSSITSGHLAAVFPIWPTWPIWPSTHKRLAILLAMFSYRRIDHFLLRWHSHRIGWWENLQESPIFDGKNHGFRFKFSQQNQSSDIGTQACKMDDIIIRNAL